MRLPARRKQFQSHIEFFKRSRADALCLFFLFLMILLVAASCAKVGYSEALRNATRKKSIYNPITFDAKLVWEATYLSPEFRLLARSKVTQWMKLPEGSTIGYVSYLADNDDGSFMVAVYTPRGYPPIDAEANNFWNFTLKLPNGRTYAPASIEEIAVTPRERRLFPYLNMWSKLYRVKFPVYSLERPFSLSLRSAAVSSTLEWK